MTETHASISVSRRRPPLYVPGRAHNPPPPHPYFRFSRLTPPHPSRQPRPCPTARRYNVFSLSFSTHAACTRPPGLRDVGCSGLGDDRQFQFKNGSGFRGIRRRIRVGFEKSLRPTRKSKTDGRPNTERHWTNSVPIAWVPNSIRG